MRADSEVFILLLLNSQIDTESKLNGRKFATICLIPCNSFLKNHITLSTSIDQISSILNCLIFAMKLHTLRITNSERIDITTFSWNKTLNYSGVNSATRNILIRAYDKTAICDWSSFS